MFASIVHQPRDSQAIRPVARHGGDDAVAGAVAQHHARPARERLRATSSRMSIRSGIGAWSGEFPFGQEVGDCGARLAAEIAVDHVLEDARVVQQALHAGVFRPTGRPCCRGRSP